MNNNKYHSAASIGPKEENSDKVFLFFESTTEVIGWIRFVISLTLLSILVAGLLYIFIPGKTVFIIGIIIICGGFIGSIRYANHIKRTKGTINLISDSRQSLDDPEEEKK